MVKKMMSTDKDNFYVITGGPGAGKTTLLENLSLKEIRHVPEVARVIIKEQVAINGDALPWGDQDKYAALMIKRSVRDFIDHLGKKEVLFFDRGILDTLAYLELIGKAVPDTFIDYAHQYRYNSVIFMLPPWKEIYSTDNERKQSYQEAVDTFTVMKKTYESFNYKVVEVPVGKVEERVQFIADHISK